jgi:O2-independent ubiquinone biosynthesis accessory factor UbiT
MHAENVPVFVLGQIAVYGTPIMSGIALRRWDGGMDPSSSIKRLVRTVPLTVVQAVTGICLRRILSRHPRLFDRLDQHRLKRFAFVATDLDLIFLIAPGSNTATVFRAPVAPNAHVRIAGAILTLLALLEGRLDGDAEFFARGLSVEGDMEAALALRNAMDDCRVDLPTDLSPLRGPLSQPARSGLRALRQLITARERTPWN